MIYEPFFVGGSPKSGTTWLGKLLDAHPEVNCKGEACMHAFTKSLIKISNEYNHLLEQRSGKFSDSNEFPLLTKANVHAIARFFIEQRMSTIMDPGKLKLKFVGEKDPYHAANYPILNDLFPEAKVFDILRDGRGVVVSAWHHNLRIKAKGVVDAGFDRFMDEAAKQWGNMVRLSRDTSRILGSRYFQIKYEDLLADPSKNFRLVLNHLGADSSEEVIESCLGEASFEKLADGRNTGEEDSKSFFRKGIADDWKNHMTPAQIQRFNARSGGMLEELGYWEK